MDFCRSCSINVLLTPDEEDKLVQYKKETGLLYHAIMDKAVQYLLDHDLHVAYDASDRTKYCPNKEETTVKSKRRVYWLTQETHDRLRSYCSTTGIPLMVVCAAAIGFYINRTDKN